MMHSNQRFFTARTLSICHIILITLSNILVQYPFELLGYHTTWGIFTYPAIFILTDLTVRLSSASLARKIIFQSMLPGLLISYGIASYIEASTSLPLRIAVASFFAYVVGQLLDITVFQRFRNKAAWWFAPILSSTAGNVVDTVLFFSIAFYHCSNPFLSQHWMEIAVIDGIFKILISFIAFIPMYGMILNLRLQQIKSNIAT